MLGVISSPLGCDAPARAVRIVQTRANRVETARPERTGRRAAAANRAVVAQNLLRDQALHTVDSEDLTVNNKLYETPRYRRGITNPSEQHK